MKIMGLVRWIADRRISELMLYRETVNEMADRSIIGWWWSRAKEPKTVVLNDHLTGVDPAAWPKHTA